MRQSIKKYLEKNSNWAEIKAILQKIYQEGFQVFIVGGAVRDALLNREVKEIDLVSSAKPENILRLFPQALDTFKKYGVVFIPLKEETRLEIVSFRKDSLKSDGRRPEFVEYGTLETDFMRRDFTINALYYDFQEDKIFDFAKGQKHLREKKIKTIGKAKDRFREDYLRMLRALRFESQLGFKLDSEIKPAISQLKQEIKKISSERITEEIHKVFYSGKTLDFIISLKKHGLFNFVFPDLDFNKTKDYLYLFEQSSLKHFYIESKERESNRALSTKVGIKEEEDGMALYKNTEAYELKKNPSSLKNITTSSYLVRNLEFEKLRLNSNRVLSWLSLGLGSLYGNKKSFQTFLKRYALSYSSQKEILSYFDSVETLIKDETKNKSNVAEKWIALNGKADFVYKFTQNLLLVSKKGGGEKESRIKLTEEQLQSYFTEFQKRAKKGKLPAPLLKGADLLNRKPVIKRENFSKILKKSYHLQLTYPQLTKKDLLNKINKQ